MPIKKVFTIKDDVLTYEEVYSFVREHSCYFTPHFEKQVKDLVLYVDKIMRHASIYYANYNQTIVAMMFVYYDSSLSQVYIPYICVDCKFYGHGIGKSLIESLKKKIDFKYIRLEVSKSNSAFVFYSKLGFVEEEDRGDKLLMRYQIIHP